MRPHLKKISVISYSLALMVFSIKTNASDFNVPFVNAADLGTFYAGWASNADDASTAFTNPAGLTRLKYPQIVGTIIGIKGSSQYTGNATPPFPPSSPQSGTANTGISAIYPEMYFSYPINNKLAFGFSQTVPFALGTSYSKNSVVRYAATRSTIVANDFSPNLAYQINDKVSVGLGIDAARLAFTLNQMVGLTLPDSESQNHLAGWGYGFHAGILYQPLVTTRVGLSFNSAMTVHTTGDSEAYIPFPPGVYRTTNQKTNATLPARTQLSVTHEINLRWTAMATIFYTNWRTFNQLTLKRVMLPNGATTSVTIPFEYHNTFDYSIGAAFKATEKCLLRAGLQFMQAPSNNRDRSVPDPIGSAVIVGLGAHYQQNKAMGYDIGYAHSFFRQTEMNTTAPFFTLSGHSNSQTNILGLQITYNFI